MNEVGSVQMASDGRRSRNPLINSKGTLVIDEKEDAATLKMSPSGDAIEPRSFQNDASKASLNFTLNMISKLNKHQMADERK